VVAISHSTNDTPQQFWGQMDLLEQTLNGTENGTEAYEESATYRRQLAMLRRSFGPVVMRELENEATEDIVLNPDSCLWVKRRGEPFSQVGGLNPMKAFTALATIATMRNTKLDNETPALETNLPLDGSRIEGLIPPVVTNPRGAHGLGSFKRRNRT
jgi:Flp pilus assembly CpaF family ATPase